MALFIGNPKYKDIASYNISLGSESVDLSTIKDDIFGVELYGMKVDAPTKVSEMSPHNAIKAKRIYSSKYCSFKAGNTTNNNCGRDDFFEYAGPFMTRTCATKLDSATGKQKVVAYKDETNINTWYSQYETAAYGTAATRTGKASVTSVSATASVYEVPNIMIEFPKFWYCRPSRYTFLVSTKDRTGESINGIPWHVSPMHKKKNYNDNSSYMEFDKIYISKYFNSRVYQDSKFHMVSTPSSPSPFTVKNEDNAGNTNVGVHSANSGMYTFDYAAWSMIWILTMIKHATINYANTLCKHNFATAITLANTTVSTGVERASSFKHIRNGVKVNTYTCPDCRYGVPSATSIANVMGLVGHMNTQTITIGTYSDGSGVGSHQCFANTLFPSSLTSLDYYTALSRYKRTVVNNTAIGEGVWADFVWSTEIASDPDQAWVLAPEHCFEADDSVAFFYGNHFWHPYKNYKLFNPIGTFSYCSGRPTGFNRGIAYDVIPKT